MPKKPTPPKPPPKKDVALLLSCMDLRLLDEIVDQLDRLHLTNRYDHVILAGASLGAVTSKFPHWGKTFWDHLGLAKKLHGVTRLLLLDHRDCGAYQMLLGTSSKDPVAERADHLKTMQTLRQQVSKKHPELEVELWLMDLKGNLEDLTHLPKAKRSATG